MIIWLLHSGCKYEGGSSIGAYSSKTKAIAAAEQFIAEDDANEWHLLTDDIVEDESRLWFWSSLQEDPVTAELYWEKASDVLVIIPMVLDKEPNK